MFRVTIHRDRCKSCGLCIHFCPRRLIVIDSELNARGVYPAKCNGSPEKCTGCANCALICPDAAIEIEEVPDKEPKK